jgi:DnaK suppressor protein
MDYVYFRQLLEKRKQAIEEIAAENTDASSVVDLDQTRVGRLTRMDAMQAQAMSMEAKRRRQQDLVKIEAAFKRIENEDYGYCVECGEEINQRRLEFDPTVLRCVECEEAS